MASGPHIATQCKLPENPYANAANSVEASSMLEGIAKAAPSRCVHCGAPSLTRFCCAGCETAFELRLRVVRDTPEPTSKGAQHGDLVRLDCEVAGLHCAACVGLITQVFGQQPGSERISINPTLGEATLWVRKDAFDFARLQKALATLGYPLSERRSKRESPHAGLLLRMGISLALAGNSMVFSFAVYFGLSAKDGPLFLTVGFINFALATLVLAIGGSYFIGHAWRSLRARVWHVDIPLALSVILAYGGACAVFFSSGFGATYFDTFCAYVALMLVGKYLPARMIERNRAAFLRDDGFAALPQARWRNNRVEETTAGDIAKDDLLVVRPGELLSVEAVLSDAQADCTLDWLNGEAEPVRFERDARIPAGAFNIGDAAFFARALSSYAQSPLRTLIGSEPRDEEIRGEQARWVERFSRVFVFATLAIGLLTWLAWAPFDWQRGLWAAVCVLIVACPCAIGLGTPLALEGTLRRLRYAGIFVRRQDVLSKLAEVDSIAFDKTGTLTHLTLSASTREALGTLAPADRAALRAMVEQSSHPASRAIAQQLADTLSVPSGRVHEIAGVGLTMANYVLRRLADASHTLRFLRNEEPLLDITLDETLRADAKRELEAMANEGYALSVLSGDKPARVAQACSALPIPPERCLGALSPEAKRDWMQGHAREKILFLGDGVNDLAAFSAAHCAGTPALDRPFVPSRADFFYRALGLAPIRDGLAAARIFTRATRFNYGFAIFYNAIVLSAAAFGVMTPLMAAILMPTSSLFIVAVNAALVRAPRATGATL